MEEFIKLYHGTNSKFIEDIKQHGLIDKKSNYGDAYWYMLSTDFESALFHATPKEEFGDVYVIEFKVPVNDADDKWFGYPYLWPPYIRSPKSSWFSPKQQIPSEMISNIHKVSYSDWLERKNKKY